MLRVSMVALFLVLAAGCAGFGPPPDTAVKAGGREIKVKKSGAVILSGRQVAKLSESGKLVGNKGETLAFLYADRVRVRGGHNIPIRTGSDGAIHLSKSAQEKAELKPILTRVTKDGRLQRGKDDAGTPIEGGADEQSRRLILVVMLLEQNNLWPGGAPPSSEEDDVGDLPGADASDEGGEATPEGSGEEGSQEGGLDWGDDE